MFLYHWVCDFQGFKVFQGKVCILNRLCKKFWPSFNSIIHSVINVPKITGIGQITIKITVGGSVVYFWDSVYTLVYRQSVCENINHHTEKATLHTRLGYRKNVQQGHKMSVTLEHFHHHCYAPTVTKYYCYKQQFTLFKYFKQRICKHNWLKVHSCSWIYPEHQR